MWLSIYSQVLIMIWSQVLDTLCQLESQLNSQLGMKDKYDPEADWPYEMALQL
jgi:hypothetical protein